MVWILVKDFYQDNPKQKSLQKIRNSSLLWGSDFGWIGRCPRHPNKHPKENLKLKDNCFTGFTSFILI